MQALMLPQFCLFDGLFNKNVPEKAQKEEESMKCETSVGNKHFCLLFTGQIGIMKAVCSGIL